MADFTVAVERIVAGLERHRHLLDERERRTVAVHEMGHALVAMSLPGSDAVHKISIIPRGVGALGYTLQRPGEDRHLASRSELCDRLAVLLGGRAAEELVIGECSTGAADDLVKATDIAEDMVLRYGMSPEVGPVAHDRYARSDAMQWLGRVGLERSPSDETARLVDAAVRALVDGALARARSVLAARRAVLDDGVARLLSRETLTEAELRPLAQAARRITDAA
jgi:cell division protease FtsH